VRYKVSTFFIIFKKLFIKIYNSIDLFYPPMEADFILAFMSFILSATIHDFIEYKVPGI
jgi:hypothetical protein